MTQSTATPSTLLTAQPSARDLERLVQLTRRRWLTVATLCGVAWFVAVAVGCLLAGAAVDLLWPLPVAGRAVALGLTLTLSLAVLLFAIVKPLLRPPPLMRVAQQIEATVPGMHNRLISVMDLCGRGAQRDDADPFLRRLIEQTGLKLQPYRIEQVVSTGPLHRSALTASAAVMIALLLGLALHDRMPTTLLRLLMPTASIPPAAYVRYTVEPGDARALQAEPITLRAVVTRGNPEQLTLRLRQGGGAWVTYPMESQADGSRAFTLSAVLDSMEYQVVGGGTWSQVHHVQMVRRPMVEQTALAVHMPAYMNLSQAQAVPADARQVSAPVGSQLAITATIGGEAQSGEILLHAAAPTQAKAAEATQRQTVWIDDQTPADAQLVGRWRWVSDDVYSGTQAWRLSASQPASGFDSNLNRFKLAPKQRMFVYIKLDAVDPPGRFRMALQQDKTQTLLLWDSPRAPLTDELKKQGRYIGALPEPGAWAKLEVPAELIGDVPPFRGMIFQVDSGRATLDRLGASEPATATTEVAQDWPVLRSYPMQVDSSTGQWVGRLPIDADGAWSLRFVGVLGHASLAMQPMPIVATLDAAPAVHVEKPGRDVTLTAPEPLPVMIRGFDDYGVWTIGLQLGPGADALGPTQWLASYDESLRTRLLLSVIDPAAHALKPGQTLHYRVVVRDRKEQEALSPIYKLALAGPQSAASGKPAGRAQMRGLLDGIAQLLSVQDALSQTIRHVVQGEAKPGEMAAPAARAPLMMTNPDGTPMTAQQVQALMQDRLSQMSPQQQQALAQEVDKQLAERANLAQELAQQTDELARDAQQSPLALPDQPQALEAMAQQIAAWAAQQSSGAEPEALAQTLSQLQQQFQEQQPQMQQLQQQLQAMEQSQQQLTVDPEQARQQMQMLLAQQQAAALQRQLEQTHEQVDHRQEQWNALAQELEGLWQQQQQQAPAPADLQARAAHQEQLMQQMQQQMEQNRQLLQVAPPPPDPAQPWSPLPQGDERPEDAPPEVIAKKMDEQRQRMRHDLSQHEKELEQAQQQLDAASEDMSRLLDQIGGTASSQRQPQAGPPGAAQPKPAGATMSPGQVMAALAQMQQSTNIRWAQGVASRAMLQQMAGSAARAQGGNSPGAAQQSRPGGASDAPQGMAMPGQVIMVELDPQALGAQQRAAVYRLPPKLREPLLQGMSERGPEGYQDLIDAYFRQLSSEVAKP